MWKRKNIKLHLIPINNYVLLSHSYKSIVCFLLFFCCVFCCFCVFVTTGRILWSEVLTDYKKKTKIPAVSCRFWNCLHSSTGVLLTTELYWKEYNCNEYIRPIPHYLSLYLLSSVFLQLSSFQNFLISGNTKRSK